MRDLRGFRQAVREHRRAVGRTQQQLARSIGLHPDVLSRKLNSRDNTVLTALEVVRIATTLAGWGALVTRSDLYVLLDLMDVPRHVVPAAAWSATPLDRLRDGRPAAVSTGDAAAAQPAEPAQPAEAEQPAEPARAAEAAHPTAESAARPRIAAAALPAPATELIGRERERAQVAAAVMESRLVTLTGVGGTGKTRLALQLARDLAGTFADGVAFIDLAPVRDPALLATATGPGAGPGADVGAGRRDVPDRGAAGPGALAGRR